MILTDLADPTPAFTGMVDLRQLADWREQRFNQHITPVTWMPDDLVMERESSFPAS